MAKALNSAQKSARRSHKVAQTAKNRELRLKRHAKNHPNDAQSLDMVRGTERKAPMTKGSAPRPNRNKAYVDSAGKTLGAPLFQAVVKAK